MATQWRSDPRRNKRHAGDAPLTLSDDGAIIDVVVTNDAGSTTSIPVCATVEPVPAVAPSFSVPPLALSVRTGADAVFVVEASGSPAPVLQWRRDGAPVPGATAPTLTLPTVSQADDGTMIDVIATNSEGSITSTPVMLTVVDTRRVAFVASSVPAPKRDRPVIEHLTAGGFDVTVSTMPVSLRPPSPVTTWCSCPPRCCRACSPTR